MKRAYILSALILTLAATMALPNFTYANDTAPLQTYNQVPTKSQLAAKIAEVKSLDGYEQYVTLNPELLSYVTNYKEFYLYLFELVDVAESMLNNYEQTSPADLEMIMAAANDAIISGKLKFGIVKQENTEVKQPETIPAQSDEPISTTTSATSNAVASTTTSSQNVSISTSVNPVTSTVTDKTPTDTVQPEVLPKAPEEVAVTPVEVPATNTPTNEDQKTSGALDSHPLAFIIISAAGLGIILALIINSRQKSYRPGRKA